ncbi:MAG: pseudouridine synthase [Desulfobacterales bacterium]
MRLQKFLSASGFCSRRRGEELIADGRVTVNGEPRKLGDKVDPEKDRVAVDGKRISLDQQLTYIAMNKPRGVVTSCRQPKDKTVLDLIDVAERVYPVGRLDKESSGLLLLTNDGRLHHRLSHPSFDHEKEYEVAVEQPLMDGAIKSLEKGILLPEGKTRPAKVRRISATRFRIVLKEGKNRQIRRMMEKMGNRVIDLKRIRISDLKLGKLKPGDWRFLNEKERQVIMRIVESKPHTTGGASSRRNKPADMPPATRF